MNKNLSCALVTLLLVTGCISFEDSNQEGWKKFNLSHPTNDLKWNFERNIIPLDDSKEIASFVYPSKLEMMQSIGNELVGISKPEWQIIKITDDFLGIHKYGIGGEGAIEENINFYAYDINDYGYSVADNEKGWIKLYSWSGDSMVSYYPLNYHISTFIMIDDTTMFSLLENETGSMEFNIRDIKNDIELSRIRLKSISGLEMEGDFEYLVFDGWFVKDENFIVVYFVSGGQLWLFDKRGKFKKKIITIDKTPFPEGVRIPQSNGGTIYGTKPEEIFFLDAAVKNGIIYLLNTIGVQEVRYVDTYSAINGQYINSFELKALKDSQLPIDIAITEDCLNVLYEEMTIKRFKITPDPSME